VSTSNIIAIIAMPEIALACQMEDFRKIISAAQIAMIMGMPMKMALLYPLIVIVTLAISAALRVEASTRQ